MCSFVRRSHATIRGWLSGPVTCELVHTIHHTESVTAVGKNILEINMPSLVDEAKKNERKTAETTLGVVAVDYADICQSALC